MFSLRLKDMHLGCRRTPPARSSLDPDSLMLVLSQVYELLCHDFEVPTTPKRHGGIIPVNLGPTAGHLYTAIHH